MTREELDVVRNHISNIPVIGAMYAPALVEHCRALLVEMDRLTAKQDALRDLPDTAAAEQGLAQRQMEQAQTTRDTAFAHGVEAMRMAVLAEFERWFLAHESPVTFVRALRVLSVDNAVTS